MIGLMLSDRGHARGLLCLVSVFWCHTFFELLTTFIEATEKSVFGEKQPLNRKISKFCYKRIHRQMYSRIPAKFYGIGKAEVTKRAWYSSQGKVFCPFLCDSWSDLAKNFMGSLFPHFPFLSQVMPLPKSVQFSRRYVRKCLPDSLQYWCLTDNDQPIIHLYRHSARTGAVVLCICSRDFLCSFLSCFKVSNCTVYVL